MRDTVIPIDATSEPSDIELLAAYAAGDRQAALVLTQKLTPMLMSYAMRLLGDRAEAEDVVQETMLRLWRAAPGWRDSGAKVSTWAYRVTGNLCIDQIRKRRTVDFDEAGEPEDGAASVADQLQDAARHKALSDALGALPERQAEALSLRHLEGWTNPQIAEAMDIGVEAVESLTARAKRKLAEILGHRKKELGYDD
jgi:RNA polymerase sigma-70 factor (ECF subfamily)